MSIEIIKTDITEMEVDAIVNAANSSLLRGGGVCGAIFKKAGFELDKECNEIGHCNTGEAVITNGYNLKAKYIIHAVAPIWNDYRNEENIKENSKKLPKLKTQKVEWREPKKREDDVIEMGFPLYSEEINNWINEFYRLKLADYNYLDNVRIYKYKKIEELSLEETLSYITFIIRGERFCDGHIASYIENGTIEKLCSNL